MYVRVFALPPLPKYDGAPAVHCKTAAVLSWSVFVCDLRVLGGMRAVAAILSWLNKLIGVVNHQNITQELEDRHKNRLCS